MICQVLPNLQEKIMVKYYRKLPCIVFVTTIEAAEYLGLQPNTLAKMRVYGTGPEYRKHGRYVRYHIDELNRWSESRKYRSTSDE